MCASTTRATTISPALADTDIARFQKEALTGHRPTWTMGANGDARSSPDIAQKRSGRAGYYTRVRDPFGMFGGRPDDAARAQGQAA